MTTKKTNEEKVRFQKQYTLTVDADNNVVAAMLETETEYKSVNAYVRQSKVNLHTLRGGVENGNYKLL